MPFSLSELAATIWRDYVVDGVPSSGIYNPEKGEIRLYHSEIEGYLSGTTPNDSVNIVGGTIDDAGIGLTTPANGAFASLTATTFTGNVDFVGGPVFSGSVDFSGLSNKAQVRTDLGLKIGEQVQGYSAGLESLKPLGTAVDKYVFTTDVNTWAEGDISSYSRTLLAQADQVASWAHLGGGAAGLRELNDNLPLTSQPGLLMTRTGIANAIEQLKAPNDDIPLATFTGTTDPIEYLGLIPPWARDIILWFVDFNFGKMIVQLGVSGVYQTTGYEWARSTIAGATTSSISETAGFSAWTNEAITGRLHLYKMEDANQWIGDFQARRHGVGKVFGNGAVTLSGPATDLRIQDALAANPFSAGKVKMRYY